MPPITIGVIGGSGLYQMDGLTNLREEYVHTPFGEPSDAFIIGDIDGISVAFLPRHGRGHRHTPSEVPYHANIYAMKMFGVRQIISVSACGSLREDLAPGHIVVPDQLFDFTRLRSSSFFGAGAVAHVSVAEPFCSTLSAQLVEAATAEGGTIHQGGTFITIEGPRFSTKGESRVFRAWGMDIIGMTTSPEAFLAREAGLCYATMAHITDYDVWHESEEAVTVDMVIQQLNQNIQLAQNTIRRLVPQLATSGDCECAHALDNAVMTTSDLIPVTTRNKLRLFLRQ